MWIFLGYREYINIYMDVFDFLLNVIYWWFYIMWFDIWYVF